jgi:hypothetical protein
MSAIIPNLSPQERAVRPLASESSSGEAGMIDLLLVAWQQRMLIGIGMLVGLVGGGAFAMTQAPAYTFTTTLELGTVQGQKGGSPIESPEATIAKINNAFLPAIERAHGQATGDPGFVSGVEARTPRGTNLLVLASRGTLDQQEVQLGIHQRLAARILEDHRKDIALVRTNLDLELEQARRAVSAIKEQVSTFSLRRTLLQERRTLAARRLQEVDNELTRITTNRDVAGKTLSGQEQVLTLMMLDLQLAREREKREELQRQLAIGLTEEEDRLAQEETGTQRTLQDSEGRVAAIQARIVHIPETRLVDQPQRSQRPVGTGRTTLAIMGLLIGAVFGSVFAWLKHGLQSRKGAGLLA